MEPYQSKSKLERERTQSTSANSASEYSMDGPTKSVRPHELKSVDVVDLTSTATFDFPPTPREETTPRTITTSARGGTATRGRGGAAPAGPARGSAAPARGGGALRGRGGLRGGAAPRSGRGGPVVGAAGKRDAPAMGEFRLNMIEIDVKGIAQNIPDSYVVVPTFEGSSYSNLKDIPLAPKKLKYIAKKVEQELDSIFGSNEDYVWDQSNRVYSLAQPSTRLFNIEFSSKEGNFNIEFSINDVPIRENLTKEQFENLLNNIMKSVMNRSSGTMYKGSFYPDYDVDNPFSMEVQRIINRITAKCQDDVQAIKPFQTVRGFQPKCALYYCAPPLRGASITEQIQQGNLKCYCTIVIKSALALADEIKLTDFEKLMKDGVCAAKTPDRTDSNYQCILTKMSIRRAYMASDDCRYNFEPVGGISTQQAKDIQFTGKDGKLTTMVAFFEEKGITIDPRQRPIFVRGYNCASGTASIPADHIMLPPQLVVGFGTALQGRMNNLSITNPSCFTALCETFAKEFFHQKELKAWGMIAKAFTPHLFPGFEAQDPVVNYAHGGSPVVTEGAWNLRNMHLYKPLPNNKPIAVLDLAGRPSLVEFMSKFDASHKKLGLNNDLKVIKSAMDFRNRDMNAIEKELMSKLPEIKTMAGCYVILPLQNTDDVYNLVKSVYESEGIATQCMKVPKTPVLNGRVARGNPHQHLCNLIAGLNVKARGINHIIPLESFKQLQVELEGTMVLGIDLQHMKKDFGVREYQKISTISMVATIDSTLTQCVMAGACQPFSQDIIQSQYLVECVESILSQRKARGATQDIQHVIILRDGTDVGSYFDFMKNEVSTIESVIKKKQKVTPKISAVCCMKRHGVRILPTDTSQMGNVKPGTVCGISNTSRGIQSNPNMVHFYLMGHHAIPGSTAVPIHVGILTNPYRLPPHIFSTLLYYFQHTDQVLQRTVSLPFAALYAHKSADRISRTLDILLQKKIYNIQEINKAISQHSTNMQNCGFL